MPAKDSKNSSPSTGNGLEPDEVFSSERLFEQVLELLKWTDLDSREDFEERAAALRSLSEEKEPV